MSKTFEGTAFTKTGRCIKLGVKHFIEGVVIERTPYRETFYVWSLINPIWKRLPLNDLSYSTRIAKGRYFSGSPENIAKEIVSELNENHPYLNRLLGPTTTPRLFLDTVHSEYPASREYGTLRRQDWAFDFGIALALDNKLEDSRKNLEAFMRVSDRSQHYFRLCAREIIASFNNEDQVYIEVISDMEEQSRSLLPFELRAKQ